MAQFKRQHFIPKFYLDNFAVNNIIWVFDRKKNEYRDQSIKDTAVIKDYYTLRKGSNKNYDIEKFLSKVESSSKIVIEKLINRERIDDIERVSLSIFIALLFTRTPEYEKQINEFTDKAVKKINKILFGNLENVKALIDIMKNEKKISPNFNAEKLYEFLKKEDYKAEYDRTNMIYMMIHNTTELCYFFHKKDWFISKTTNGTEFITSDNPIIKIPTSEQIKKAQVYGIDTPGVKKIFPLNYCTSLCIGDDGEFLGFGSLDKEHVLTINRYIADNSDRFIFGRSKDILEKIVRITKIDEYMKTERVQVP